MSNRFAGLFRLGTPEDLISQAKDYTDFDIDINQGVQARWDAELNEKALRTPIVDRDELSQAWMNLQGESRDLLNDPGDYRGITHGTEVAFPDEINDLRNQQMIEFDNDFERSRHRWRTHPALKDLEQVPNYFQIENDRWQSKGKAPDDLDLLNNYARRIKQYPPAYFEGSAGREFNADMVDQWRNRKLLEIEPTMNPRDPRVLNSQQARRDSQAQMRKFIDNMNNPKPQAIPDQLPSTVELPKSLRNLDAMKGDIRAISDESSKLMQELGIPPDTQPTDMRRISEEAGQLLEDLGGPRTNVEYFRDGRVIRPRTPTTESLLRDLDQIPAPKPATTPNTPTTQPRIVRKGPGTALTNIPKGLGVEVAADAALQFAAGESPEQSIYGAFTNLIPQGGPVANTELPLVIGGREYQKTNEPSRVIGPDGKAYGLQIKNGEYEVVDYGRGAAGGRPIYSDFTDLVGAIGNATEQRIRGNMPPPDKDDKVLRNEGRYILDALWNGKVPYVSR